MKTCNSITNCREVKTLLFTKNGYLIEECTKCGHRFVKNPDRRSHVAHVYTDDYFLGGHFAGYPDYFGERDLLVNSGVWYSKLLSKYIELGELLDVGSAAGFIPKGFEQEGWKVHGIEPNETMASYGRENLHLDITTETLESFSSSSKYDLITFIQVIGHFLDLDKAIQNAERMLRSGGMVLVESWNMKSPIARVLGKFWHEYSPPSVLHWFSDQSLSGLFRYYGFELVAKGFPAKRISVSHAVSLMRGKVPDFAHKGKLVDFICGSIGSSVICYPPIDLKWYLLRRSKR